MTIFGKPLENFFIAPALRDGLSSNVDLKTVITNSITYYTQILTGLAAFVAFCYIIYAGYIMFTAFGDEAKYATGKKTLQYAVIGFIIAMAAWFIINLFARVLGYKPTP